LKSYFQRPFRDGPEYLQVRRNAGAEDSHILIA
jgi:hypothetical protein